ncbi:MAG: class I SAM-dependent methyltransferase [Leptolyngbyaceae cyanobacterium]
MDYKDLKRSLTDFSGKDLEQRKHWYSPAAEAYNQSRPRYPRSLIHQVIEIAQLSPASNILEVGCGPATATVDFARIGCSMLCLELNSHFCKLAKENCQPYPNVKILNTAFEEWTLEVGKFDAVLAASSFHWIPADVGYPKAAQALQQNGRLILLWNKELQPTYKVHQSLAKIYQAHAPKLSKFEDIETQEKILQGLGQIIVDSGYFQNIVSGSVESEAIYSTNEYLALLNTYSPYLKLETQTREILFGALRNKIESDFGGRLQLSYISAFHIAQKC